MPVMRIINLTMMVVNDYAEKKGKSKEVWYEIKIDHRFNHKHPEFRSL